MTAVNRTFIRYLLHFIVFLPYYSWVKAAETAVKDATQLLEQAKEAAATAATAVQELRMPQTQELILDWVQQRQQQQQTMQRLLKVH